MAGFLLAGRQRVKEAWENALPDGCGRNGGAGSRVDRTESCLFKVDIFGKSRRRTQAEFEYVSPFPDVSGL